MNFAFCTTILAWLTAAFYILFTLLPDSNSLMVQWYWVAVWQIGLICPIFWLLGRIWQQRGISPLGNGLDWVSGAIALGLVISTTFAQFRPQALWYSWAAFGFLAALYALNDWLRTPQQRFQLLVSQGYLNLAFIVLSLSLWTTQTLLPELARLEKLKQYGIKQSFHLAVLELRNWAPIGHQNYVAGYLLLALPLLLGLSIRQTGWRRWLWVTGVVLGLVNLYTTSSRGGWLGLAGMCVVALAILLWRGRLKNYWFRWGAIATVTLVLLFALANPRLRSLLSQGGGELAYRLINLNVGWPMGLAHPWSGVGLGGVPLLYQKYRPIWAGRESELAYQLHSTPAQLWAEMGLWGIVPGIGAIALLSYLLWRWLRQNHQDLGSTSISGVGSGQARGHCPYRWCRCLSPDHNQPDAILIGSLAGGLFAYSLLSLTDYQLDNIAISGTLAIYLACLAATLRDGLQDLDRNPFSQRNCDPGRENGFLERLDANRGTVHAPLQYSAFLVFAGLGILLGMVLWLIPVHRAWYFSSQGFKALEAGNVPTFVTRLTLAQQLAPGEPYYPYQLGWNLGKLALQTREVQQQQSLLQAAIEELEKGLAISPYQEFGYNNLAWLLLKNNPAAASASFVRAAQLLPAKREVMSGLGLSLLAQGKVDLAIAAFTLEGLRDPLFITNPLWRSRQLQPLSSQILARLERQYTAWLQEYSQPGDFNTYLHRCRGGLYWWQGNFTAARRDLEIGGTPVSLMLLKLAEGQPIARELAQMPESAAKLVLMAWFDPNRRSELLEKAWLIAQQEPLSGKLKQDLAESMANSASFHQWLTEFAPIWQYHRQRLGFGLVSRHLDGPPPTDFAPVVENLAMVNWFAELLPSPVYLPELDLALQPQREALWLQVLEKDGN